MLGILRWKEEQGGGGAETLCCVTANQLTLFHHADVDAALETTGLAVAPVVLGDGAAPIERTGEGGFTLHAAPAGGGGRGEESGEEGKCHASPLCIRPCGGEGNECEL